MSGRLLDMVDEHPRVGRHHRLQLVVPAPRRYGGYDLMVSVPMYSGSVSTNNSAMWSSIALDARGQWLVADLVAPRRRIQPGQLMAGDQLQLVDVGHSVQRGRRSHQGRSARGSDRVVPQRGNGAGLISSANTVNLVDGCNWDVLAPDYYDQWPPIYNQSQGDSRFGTTLDVRHDELLGGRRPRQGKKIRFRREGVASGTQWAGNQGGDNPFYIDYLMSWLYANRDVVEVISYFEEPAAYLVSDITTPAHNPTARAMYQSKIAQYAGS